MSYLQNIRTVLKPKLLPIIAQVGGKILVGVIQSSSGTLCAIKS